MNPPIPLVMRIVMLVDWRMEYFLCLIGPKNFHPKPNWMAIYFQFSLVQEWMRRPSIGARDFEAFIRQGEQAQGGHEGLLRKRFSVCGWEEEKERRRKCEEFF